MAQPPRSPFRRFLREINRRSVWQVLGLYVAGSWVAFQVIVTLGEVFVLPAWLPAFTLTLLGLGFPFVVATAFVQRGGPGRTPEEGEAEEVAGEADIQLRLLTWRHAFELGVGGFVLLGLVVAAWFLTGRGTPAVRESALVPVPESSIAVLPFEDLAGDDDYFSAGLTEEVLNTLAQISSLKVSARTSVFAFQNAALDVRTIADSLGVANVLEGSVRRDGGDVRINVQLIDAESGLGLWSASYDRELSDIFAVQNAIARAIASQLRLTLSSGGSGLVALGGSSVPEAYDAYLLGRFDWNQRTLESIREAIDAFRRATERDPEYAEAYSGLADSYAVLDRYALFAGDQFDMRAAHEQALDAAERAVELAPESGMALASLGFAYSKLGRWEEAERALEEAVERSPGYATAHQWLGLLLGDLGRPNEGLVHTRRAAVLDPVSPVVRITLATLLRQSGRVEEALAETRSAISMDPDWGTAWSYLGVGLLDVAQYDDAVEAFLTSASLRGVSDMTAARSAFQAIVTYRRTGEPQMVSWADATPDYYSLTGQKEEALRIFEEMVRRGGYESAAAQHAGSTGALLRGDPRYEALLAEAGITW